MKGRRTYWHLEGLGRRPTDYEVAGTRLLYYPGRGFEVEVPATAWYAAHQQGSPLRCADWEAFRDPRETTYAAYTARQAEQETFVDGALRAAAEGGGDAHLAPAWVAAAAELLGPLRFACHGLQMLSAFVARRSFRMEYRLRRKDGAYRWILDTGIPRWTPGGAFAGFVGSCIDITELKEAHDAIVRGRAARAEADALRHADELKDHFLAIVSHELRTPINAIMGFASVLDDEVAGAVSPRQHDLLGKVLRGADGLLALVDDLLDMSRIKAGKFHIEPARIAFKTVVEDALTELAALAAPRGVQLVAEVAASLPPIVGDERRLGQVLRNLAGNAIKFSPDEGLVTVRAFPRDGRLRVEVTDQGPGIAEADLARLFRPFVQLETGPRRSQGGTIGAESRVGAGTTFWFELPA